MQDIQDRLAANPQSVSHVLLVSVDHEQNGGNENDLLKVFSQNFADRDFTLNMRGLPHPMVLRWSAVNGSSDLFWIYSIYSDLVTTQATKMIIEQLQCPIRFLVLKPLEYLEAARAGVELQLRGVEDNHGSESPRQA